MMPLILLGDGVRQLRAGHNLCLVNKELGDRDQKGAIQPILSSWDPESFVIRTTFSLEYEKGMDDFQDSTYIQKWVPNTQKVLAGFGVVAEITSQPGSE